MKRKVKTAILPIAGLGTRFLPLSKVIPKEFFPLGSKPVIQYIVEEALETGVEKIVFVISPEKKEIFDKYILKYFKEDPDLLAILKKRKKQEAIEALNTIPKIDWEYTIQKEPLGDGDAILKAEKFVQNGPFIVLFGDDISFNPGGPSMAVQLVNAHSKIQKSLLCLYKMPKEKLSSYGVPRVKKVKDRLYKIEDLIEKPKENPPSSFACVGKYLLTPEIFDYLKKTKAHNGEIILANALRSMIQDKKEIYGLDVQGRWLECGTKGKWMESFLYFSKMAKD